LIHRYQDTHLSPPLYTQILGLSPIHWVYRCLCGRNCDDDSQCPSNQKCCQTGCDGRQCQAPNGKNESRSDTTAFAHIKHILLSPGRPEILKKKLNNPLLRALFQLCRSRRVSWCNRYSRLQPVMM
uniref:WAP domain-containing protein n=1 Tax=Leptobrachium leishanense TaxID=445787 RepID=A0A8C5QTZ6_9ANUR